MFDLKTEASGEDFKVKNLDVPLVGSCVNHNDVCKNVTAKKSKRKKKSKKVNVQELKNKEKLNKKEESKVNKGNQLVNDNTGQSKVLTGKKIRALKRKKRKLNKAEQLVQANAGQFKVGKKSKCNNKEG